MPKTVECRNGCGQLIWFDWNARAGEPGRSDRGKMIPLQVSEKGEMLSEKHDCPNSTYNKQGAGGNSSSGTTQQTTRTSSSSVDYTGIKSALEHVADRLDILVRYYGDLLDQIKADKKLSDPKEINDPLNDDGDSSREEGDFSER